MKTWIILAITTAFCESIRDVLTKKVTPKIDVYSIAFSVNFLTSIFLSPILFWVKIPELNHEFWVALAMGATLNAIAYSLFIKALNQSDLSITAPITTFTPLFLLLSSPLMLGEFPTQMGLLGVCLIVAGSYILNLNPTEKGYFVPFQAILKQPGPRLVLIVAFLWSLTSNFDKIGVQHSSPLFWALSIYVLISFLLMPMVILKSQLKLNIIRDYGPQLLLMGLLNAITVGCQMMALNLTLVSYVISVKRISVVFSVIWGFLFFQEAQIKQRLIGSIIMVLGVTLIALF